MSLKRNKPMPHVAPVPRYDSDDEALRWSCSVYHLSPNASGVPMVHEASIEMAYQLEDRRVKRWLE